MVIEPMEFKRLGPFPDQKRTKYFCFIVTYINKLFWIWRSYILAKGLVSNFWNQINLGML